MTPVAELVLLVDDDPLARITRAILEWDGWRVIAVADGPAGIQAFLERPEEFAVVVSDVVRPDGMSGPEMVERLLSFRPNLPVVFTTGWPERIPAALRQRFPVLQKPFLSAELISAVRAARAGFDRLPALIAHAGKSAAWRFLEFFTANIRNRNTRAAYARAVTQFLRWGEAHGIRNLAQIKPVAYIEQHPAAAPTVKQHLAALRMLFDWLVTGQIVPVNPAWSVRGPRHVVKRGKTPVLKADEARALLDSIRIDTIVGLRDRALLGLMCYTFARVSAAVHMRVEDYYQNGKRCRPGCWQSHRRARSR